ncbi:MAG: FkbM family methyltransferase, partial [Caulobacteraceae bacterium]
MRTTGGGAASRQDDLVFDVGMNECEDTAFYLKKGFRVVAVEANPAACEEASKRFAPEIADGRLQIVNRAISPTRDALTFYVCTSFSAWSTTSPGLRDRWSGEGATFETIEVEGCRTEDLIEEFGIPYYAKIDIEGSDLVCLNGFGASAEKPKYASVEVDFYKVDELVTCAFDLGYRKFALVGQSGVEGRRAPLPALEGASVEHEFHRYSTGPFGRELPAKWVSADEVRRQCGRVIWQYRGAGVVRRL